MKNKTKLVTTATRQNKTTKKKKIIQKTPSASFCGNKLTLFLPTKYSNNQKTKRIKKSS